MDGMMGVEQGGWLDPGRVSERSFLRRFVKLLFYFVFIIRLLWYSNARDFNLLACCF